VARFDPLLFQNMLQLRDFIAFITRRSAVQVCFPIQGPERSGLFYMLYTVYILYSHAYLKHYTGFTSNLEQRLLSHYKLGKGWTAKYRPWQLIYSKEFNTKKEAMEYEKWLKTGIGRDFIKTLLH